MTVFLTDIQEMRTKLQQLEDENRSLNERNVRLNDDLSRRNEVARRTAEEVRINPFVSANKPNALRLSDRTNADKSSQLTASIRVSWRSVVVDPTQSTLFGGLVCKSLRMSYRNV